MDKITCAFTLSPALQAASSMRDPSISALIQIAIEPISWAVWLNHKRFIDLENKYSTVCGKAMSLQLCQHIADSVLLRSTGSLCQTSQSIPKSIYTTMRANSFHKIKTRVKCASDLGMHPQTCIVRNLRHDPTLFPSIGI
jgi:hypothetical protein